jgi:hypothetical protein
MVWNCPHCRAPLVLSQAALGDSWNLCRCPKCGGAGLVSSIEKRVIKLEGIPAHERNVLIPKVLLEASANTRPISWPKTPDKPVIRTATRRSIPKRPDIFATQTQTGIQDRTKTIPSKLMEDITLAPKIEPSVTTFEMPVTPPPMTAKAMKALADTTQILESEKEYQELNKTVLIVPRLFDIPAMPMITVAGYSVRNSDRGREKTIDFPSALPDLAEGSAERSFLAQILAILPMIAFVVLCGSLGWTTVRFTDNRAPSSYQAHSRSARDSRDLIDHVNQDAMAPLHSAYDDDPTNIRARSSDIPAYDHPDAKSSIIGSISANRSYPLLEKDGSWVKFAFDKSHSAWVNVAAIDLIP